VGHAVQYQEPFHCLSSLQGDSLSNKEGIRLKYLCADNYAYMVTIDKNPKAAYYILKMKNPFTSLISIIGGNR